MNISQAEICRKKRQDVIPSKGAKTGKRPTILTYYKEEKECRWKFLKDPKGYNSKEKKRVMTEVLRIMFETTFQHHY